MTKPARDANLRWLGFLLSALVAVLVIPFGAGTASAATATAAQTRLGPHTLVAQVVVGPQGGIGAGQRVGNARPAYDFVLATGVAAKTGARTFGNFGADGLRAAAQAEDRNGLTQVGRALQKHSGRDGSVFSGLSKGTASARNEQGLNVLDKILGDTGGRTEMLDRVTNIWDSSGRGVRFGNDGSFMGFLEPR